MVAQQTLGAQYILSPTGATSLNPTPGTYTLGRIRQSGVGPVVQIDMAGVRSYCGEREKIKKSQNERTKERQTEREIDQNKVKEKEEGRTKPGVYKTPKEKRDKILVEVDNDKIVELQSQASWMFEKLRKGEKIEILKDQEVL